MADSHHNSQIPRSPNSPTSSRHTTVSTTSKLRDSCHACALSKVKCHKEKPTCSRCTRRGIACEYFVTKRPGRKRDNSQSTNNETNSDTINTVRPASSGEQAPWTGAKDSTTYATLYGSNDYLTPLDLSPTSPKPRNVSVAESSSSDIFSDLLMPLEPCLSSALVGMRNEFDHFFTSPIDFPEPEALEAHNFTQGSIDISKLLMPGDTNPESSSEISSIDRSNAFKVSSPSSNVQTLSSSDTSVSDASDLSCYCLMQALDLMKNLSTTKSSSPALLSGLDESTTVSNIGHGSSPLVQTVVLENKHAIEAVSNMLQCSCAEDGYLLTILSMIFFKILGRYAAGARRQFGEVTDRGDKPSGRDDHESLGRIAAQVILGELHRVQWLLNQLSPRLKACGVGTGNKGGGILGREISRGDFQISSLSNGGSTTTPFSAIILNHVETDLRKALSALSSEIIDMLRQS